MAGTYIYTLTGSAVSSLRDGVDTVAVYAESAAEALVLVKSRYTKHGSGPSDAAWALVTPTLGAAAADMEGWRFRIKVGTVVDCTVTGAAAATLDDIADLMVIALNATAPIANAAYATPNLTISSIADNIGNLAVTAWLLPPLADADFEDPTNSFTGFLSTIVDEGIAGAALTIALLPAVAVPHFIGAYTAR